LHSTFRKNNWQRIQCLYMGSHLVLHCNTGLLKLLGPQATFRCSNVASSWQKMISVFTWEQHWTHQRQTVLEHLACPSECPSPAAEEADPLLLLAAGAHHKIKMLVLQSAECYLLRVLNKMVTTLCIWKVYCHSHYN
jgi:hypothetical protein